MEGAEKNSSPLSTLLRAEWDKAWQEAYGIMMSVDLNLHPDDEPDVVADVKAAQQKVDQFSPTRDRKAFYNFNKKLLGKIDNEVLGIKPTITPLDLLEKIREVSEHLENLWLEHAQKIIEAKPGEHLKHLAPTQVIGSHARSQTKPDKSYSAHYLAYEVVMPYVQETLEQLNAQANKDLTASTTAIEEAVKAASGTNSR